MKIIDKLNILSSLWLNKNGPKIFSFHDCLPDIFSGYIELLVSKRFKILGSDDLLERLNRKNKSKSEAYSKEAVLTFDDGRRNCWTVIYPLLKKFKIKAIFFIIPEKIKDTDEHYPNLEDYWAGRVSWENLYISHRRQPYLTSKELEIMSASGLVECHSHSMQHSVVRVSSKVIDFQHPGVYEMPVYFDEWIDAGMPLLEYQWGMPIYEHVWSPLASNIYMPDRRVDTLMNEFVKKNGGFLFFKNKNWRIRLYEYYSSQKATFRPGHFKKNETNEDIGESLLKSKLWIEKKFKKTCHFFSLPLYHGNCEILKRASESGYKAVFTGPKVFESEHKSLRLKRDRAFLLTRIPSFWIKFLSYL